MTVKTKSVVKKLPDPEESREVQLNINPQALIQAAIEKNVPIEILERLLAMRERLQKEQAEIAFREAMSLFQSKCPIIGKSKAVKNKDGKTTRYKYAPLDEIVRQVQPLIFECGLSYDIEARFVQDPSAVEVTVRVSHNLGHSKETSFQAPVDPESYMNAPQKGASASTFAKRYAFCNAFGILTGDEDDDATSIPVQENTEEARRHAEDVKRTEGLPDNIKQGFRILGYTLNTVIIFCYKFSWDNGAILREINKIVDMKAAK
jgi:hypothetical protein